MRKTKMTRDEALAILLETRTLSPDLFGPLGLSKDTMARLAKEPAEKMTAAVEGLLRRAKLLS